MVGTVNHHGDTMTHMCLSRNANGVAVGGGSVRACFPSTVLHCMMGRPLRLLRTRNGCSVGTGLSNNNFANRDRTLHLTVTHTLIGVSTGSGGTLGSTNFVAHSSHTMRHGGPNRPGTHHHFRFDGHWSCACVCVCVRVVVTRLGDLMSGSIEFRWSKAARQLVWH